MSGHFLRASLPFLTAGVLLQSTGVCAETFEVLNYAPPGAWPVQILKDGRAYVRPDGNGMITFHVGRFDSSMTPLAFVVKWRELVETAVPGPAPEPQIRREGDFSFAVGARHARSNGKAVTLSLVTVTGRGRTVGIVGMAAGDEALRELGAFFETVALTPAASAGTTWGPPVSGASGLVGRWWKDAGGSNYFWYEFSDKGFFSYRVTTRRFPGDLPRAGQSDHIYDLHGLDDDPQLFFRVRGWQGPPRDQWRVGLLVC